MKLSNKSTLKFLDENRRGRLDLLEVYDLPPWVAIYAALHRFGYPNNKLTNDSQSTFSYIFNTEFDGLFIELSDFKAFVTVNLVYTDAAGEDGANEHRESLTEVARELVEALKTPVDHFGAMFDPATSSFTE